MHHQQHDFYSISNGLFSAHDEQSLASENASLGQSQAQRPNPEIFLDTHHPSVQASPAWKLTSADRGNRLAPLSDNPITDFANADELPDVATLRKLKVATFFGSAAE